MKSIITNTKTFIIALIGLVGGSIWTVNSNWDQEPIILTVVSLIEILGYLILKLVTSKESEELNTGIKNEHNITNNGKIKKQINIQNNSGKIEM
jgi:hypothetical protein